MSLLLKLFYRNEWTVGIRKINENSELPTENKAFYTQIKGECHSWYADPFLFDNDGKTYCFFEIMNLKRNIGSIGVCEVKGGVCGKPTEIIREPFHMSFPNVFRYGESIYMIPETSAAEEIRLYRAKSFPLEWELCGTLVSGIDAVDTTVKFENDALYLFTYLDREKESRIYKVDMNEKSAKRIEADGVANYRPAGNPFLYKGTMLRPLQDCENAYGNRVFLYDEKGKISDNTYSSSLYGTVEPENIRTNGKFQPQFTHTIARTADYEVVDFTIWRFHLLKLAYKFFKSGK